MINSPGVFQYTPRVYVYTLNHVILRHRPRGRPDGVGWLPRRVQTDGQVSWRRGKFRQRGVVPRK